MPSFPPPLASSSHNLPSSTARPIPGPSQGSRWPQQPQNHRVAANPARRLSGQSSAQGSSNSPRSGQFRSALNNSPSCGRAPQGQYYGVRGGQTIDGRPLLLHEELVSDSESILLSVPNHQARQQRSAETRQHLDPNQVQSSRLPQHTNPFVSDRQEIPLGTPGPHSASQFASPNSAGLPPSDQDGVALPSTRYDETLLSPRDAVLRVWMDSENLDVFYTQAYDYFSGGGFWSIVLSRAMNIITYGFTVFFSLFLLGCVDIANVHNHKTLQDSVIPNCFWRFNVLVKLICFGFAAFLAVQTVRLLRDIIILSYFHAFFKIGLELPEADLQSMSWENVVSRMSEVAATLPESAFRPVLRVDAKDIAQRIMRQDNYLIALVNKDILRLEESRKFRFWPVLTVLMEWTMRFCILDYVFDSRHNMRKAFLSEQYRFSLVAGLKRRFLLAGILTTVLAPLTLTWIIMYGMFKYGEEIYRRPSTLSFRRYTPFAQWKIREFNELDYEFRKRIRRSYVPAARYLDEFPNRVLVILASFVTYLSGSVFLVLTVATMVNGDLLMNFELTEGKAVFFWLSIFGTLAAVSRGMIPSETQVPNPRRHLRRVIRYIHYHPKHWRHRYHTSKVRAEFSALYQYRVLNFTSEIMGVFLTPWCCFHAFSDSAEDVIDFFRKFTKKNERVGYVCSFAEFDFQLLGNQETEQIQEETDLFAMNDAKMEQSFMTFMKNHSHWEPRDQAGQRFANQMGMSRMQQSQQRYLHQDESSYSEYDSDSDTSHGYGCRRRRRSRRRVMDFSRVGQSRIINHLHEEDGLVANTQPLLNQAEDFLEPVDHSVQPEATREQQYAGKGIATPRGQQMIPMGASSHTIKAHPPLTGPQMPVAGTGQAPTDGIGRPTISGATAPPNDALGSNQHHDDDALELLWDGKS